MAKKRTKTTSQKPTAQPIQPLPSDDQNSRRLLFAVLGASYILYVLWGLLSNSTWDDDCASRYFTTLNAFRNPYEFVSLWNRPLFIVVFCIPVAILGKLAIPLVMSFISALGAWFLYQAARELRFQYALLIVPFFLFQPFFLGTGRDAMTEPMAATMLAWGFYAALKHRWLVFALLGAALPLARTELALLLPIWAYVLFRAKQYKLIPLLGLGVVLWNIAGWIITGDALFLYNQTFGRADEENRYGSQPINTYLARYMYVVGPIVFYFFLLGLINQVRKRDIRPLVLIQFLLGFCIYTLLAWKITIGQSAGFLRNLIPLSPLAALIALGGFEYYAESIRKGQHKVFLMLTCLALGAVVILGYPYKLVMHHSISSGKEIDFFSISVVAAIAIISSLGVVLYKVIQPKHLRIWAIVLGLATTGYALYTEPPWANMNSEREMINRLVECYQDCGLESAPRTLCAHFWFHWVGGYVAIREGSRYMPMLLDTLHAAPYGSVIIWESHYSNRIGNNINQSDLSDVNKYTLLGTFYPEDGTKVAYMYIKKDPDKTAMQYLDELIAKNDYAPELLIQRANLHSAGGDQVKAQADLNKALELNPGSNMIKMSLANYYLKSGQNENVVNLASQIVKDNADFIGAYSLMGSAYFNLAQYPQAIKSFTSILEKDKDNKEAYYNIGISYLRQNNKDDGCKYLREAKRLNMDSADNLITQYCN